MSQPIPCPECNGTGKCPVCDGTGRVRFPRADGTPPNSRCPSCNDTDYPIMPGECGCCAGTGTCYD